MGQKRGCSGRLVVEVGNKLGGMKSSGYRGLDWCEGNNSLTTLESGVGRAGWRGWVCHGKGSSVEAGRMGPSRILEFG